MNNKKYGYSFDISEDQTMEEFIAFVIDKPEIHYDAVLNAEIQSIQKKYIPMVVCTGTYSVHWKATSIWEHREEYTVYEDKIVFVDKYGREYSIQEEGTTPVYKRVPKTDWKMVIDDIKYSDKSFTRDYSCLLSYNGEESQITNWIAQNYLAGKQAYQEIDDSQISEIQLVSINRRRILSAAESKCKDSALRSVKKEIPGNRYRDFYFDFNSNIDIENICYIPMYLVTYTYNGKQHEVWFSGCEKDKYLDTSKNVNSFYAKASRGMYTTSVISFGITLLLIIAALINKSKPLDFMVKLTYVIIVVSAVSLITLICGAIFKKIGGKISNRRQKIKQQLSEIYMHSEMPFQVRMLEMEKIVKSSCKGKLSKTNKENKCSKKKIGIICLSVIIVITALIIGISAFSNKTNNDLVGTWRAEHDSSMSITFKNNGDMIVRYGNAVDDGLSYNITDDTVTVTFAPNVTETYGFVVEGDTLIFGEYYYTRVK